MLVRQGSQQVGAGQRTTSFGLHAANLVLACAAANRGRLRTGVVPALLACG